MQKLKRFGLDKKIIEAANQNKVIAGRSAGAIVISKAGSSDSRHYKSGKKYTYVRGLGIFNIFLAPHYMNSERPQDMPLTLKKHSQHIAIGVDSASALAVNDDIFEVVSSNDESGVYKIYYKNGKFVQYKVENHGKVCDLLVKQ